MTRVEYGRAGYDVRISTAKDGTATLSCGWLGAGDIALSAQELEDLRAGKSPPRALAAFEPATVRDGIDHTHVGDRRIEQIELDVARSLADIDWERLCTEPAVRLCRVLPRTVEQPLQLPLRVLELDVFDRAQSIEQLRDDVFGTHEPVRVRQAFVVGTTPRDDAVEYRLRHRWPTVDVLHFHDATFLNALRDPEATTAPDVVGTLGWFLRLPEWRMRLVVLAFPGVPPAPVVRRLATELVERGGPAIVVSSAPLDDWRAFYDLLIHDAPIDLAVHKLPIGNTAAWLGAGREEALRPSSIGERLVEWSRTNRQARERQEARTAEPAAFRDALSKLESDWPQLVFEQHEGGGLLPMTGHIEALRAATISTDAFDGALESRSIDTAKDAEPKGAAPDPDLEPRHLNATLWRHAPGRSGQGALEPIPQRVEHTPWRDLVQPWRWWDSLHLGLDIGPRSVTTASDLPILDDDFAWLGDGAWVELVVTPLDFEVDGHLAQPLWLPRRGSSDRIYFAIRPRLEPPLETYRIRFGLYRDNNLLQSWLLAVLGEGELLRSAGEPDQATEPRAALARALGLRDAGRPRSDGPDAGPLEVDRLPPGNFVFLARPEFHAAGVNEARACPPRTVSVLANDLEGKRHLMVKGTDLALAVDPDGARVEKAIAGIRSALDKITAQPMLDAENRPLGPEFVAYRYATSTPAQLIEDLQILARAGWSLYRSIIGDEDADRRLQECLRDPDATIQAVHTDLRKTIPWSLIYDRLFDPRVLHVDGDPVMTATCLAALPDANGTLGTRHCGESERCELHPLRIAARRDEGMPVVVPKTVACPLRFWGFAHRVETPPRTVRAATAEGLPGIVDAVENGTPTAVGVGYYPFGCWPTHLEQLQRLPEIAVHGPRNDRDGVIALLDLQDLDVYYLFCHAGDNALRFMANAGGADTVTEDDLQIKDWRHRPLAVLNGCGTAGWSPAAIAPLIETFIRKKAGAVIGTEVRVHEDFGARIGHELLDRFLSGKPIGDALLAARRKLLREFNPLGLVYTLYGTAELALRTRPRAPATPGP